jgi:hypothetical protein
MITARVTHERFLEQECLTRFLSIDKIPTRQDFSQCEIAVVTHDRVTCPASAEQRSWICYALPEMLPELHANVALLLWEKRGRLVISSAPLTEASYQTALQSYDWIDFAADDPAESLSLYRSLDPWTSALSHVIDRSAHTFLPIQQEDLEVAGRMKREGRDVVQDSQVVPIFLGSGKGSLVTQALDLWGHSAPPRELYIEAGQTPSLDDLLWTVDELSAHIPAGETLHVSLVGTETQRLGQPRSVRSLIRQRYAGRIQLGLYQPKLREGVRMEGNTVILSNDHWLLRLVGSSCGVGQRANRELHAMISRSVECARNPVLEEEVLSALVEVSSAC